MAEDPDGLAAPHGPLSELEHETESAFSQHPDNSGIPSWASKSYRRLHHKLQKKEHRLEKRFQQIGDCKERIDIMTEHLRNVQFELVRTQELLDAKAKAIESEDHMKRIAEQELSRLRSDIAKMDKDTRKANEKTHSMQNDLYSAKDKIERFMMQKNWNQEELEQWVLATKQNEADFAALARYRKQDDLRIRTSSMQIEQLTKETLELQNSLDLEVTETVSVQIELDRMATDFKDMHLERQEIVSQWEQAQNTLIKRDEEICQAALTVQKLKGEIRDSRTRITDDTTILEQHKVNNQSLELEIKVSEKNSEKVRDQLQEEQASFHRVEIEAETRKRELQEGVSVLHQTEQAVAAAKQAQIEKLTRLDGYEQKVVIAKERLKAELARSGDVEGQSQQVQKLYDEAVERNGQYEKQLHSLMQTLFKSNQKLFDIRKIEANTMALISGTQVSLRNVQSQIAQFDQQSIQQQEMLYGIEFQLQQMERKVTRASGKRTFNEKIELNGKINKLTEDLDQEKSQEKLLVAQLKAIISTIDNRQKRLTAKTSELFRLNELLNEHLLQSQAAERRLTQSQGQRDDLILQCDMLRFETQQLRETLLKHVDQVYFLENRQNQLKLEMEEKEKQLELEDSVIRSELRLEEERRHKVALEVRERRHKIDTLRNKYDAIAGKLRGSNGDEICSQAEYIIKAAQQKEELIRAGDLLNAAVKEEEKKLRFLDKARTELKVNNNLYRQSFQSADPNGADAELKNELSQKKKSYEGILTKKKLGLRELQADCEERIRLVREMEDDIRNLHAEVSSQNRHHVELTDRITSLTTKIHTLLAKIRELVEARVRPEPEIRSIFIFIKQSTIDTVKSALSGSIIPSFKIEAFANNK